MISRKHALNLLRKSGVSQNVFNHSLAVEKLAMSSAGKIAKHHKVDLELVSCGALLHDIGRSRTHGIRHGVAGGQILRELEFPDLAKLAERHLGAGITKTEAKKLGLPTDIGLVPHTIEEKIVANADNYLSGERVMNWDEFQEYWSAKFKHSQSIYKRIIELAEEIKKLEAS